MNQQDRQIMFHESANRKEIPLYTHRSSAPPGGLPSLSTKVLKG